MTTRGDAAMRAAFVLGLAVLSWVPVLALVLWLVR